jgi:hypothetical protein
MGNKKNWTREKDFEYEDFIRAWQKSSSMDDVCDEFHISRQRCFGIRQHLRRNGVKLKSFYRSKYVPAECHSPQWLPKLKKGLAKCRVFTPPVLAYMFKVSRQRAHQIVEAGLAEGLITMKKSPSGTVYLLKEDVK